MEIFWDVDARAGKYKDKKIVTKAWSSRPSFISTTSLQYAVIIIMYRV